MIETELVNSISGCIKVILGDKLYEIKINEVENPSRGEGNVNENQNEEVTYEGEKIERGKGCVGADNEDEHVEMERGNLKELSNATSQRSVEGPKLGLGSYG